MVKILDVALGETFWMPPGGVVEVDEDFHLTAERETQEETGIIVQVYRESQMTKTYEFEFQDQKYITTTHFFLAEYMGEDRNFDPEKVEKFIEGWEWVPLKQAFDRLYRWEEIQTSVYQLIFPLLRSENGSASSIATKKAR